MFAWHTKNSFFLQASHHIVKDLKLSTIFFRFDRLSRIVTKIDLFKCKNCSQNFLEINV